MDVIILAALVFIGLLLAVVLIHEFGHFIAAKRTGCLVEEFGFGFPPRLWSHKWGETEYSINLLPIGGFVRIEGEDMENDNPGPRSFATKAAWQRIIILSAGVVMNVVLAWILLSAQSVVGVPMLLEQENDQHMTDFQTYITGVAPESPAELAGLQSLDRIIKINEIEQPGINDIQAETEAAAGQAITMVVDRQGTEETVTVTVRNNPPEGEGRLGIELAATGLQKFPWWQAPWQGLVRTFEMLKAILTQFGLIIGRMITGNGSTIELAGPVGIAVYTKEAASLGWAYILEFGALISLNLAIINILPLPALDGGRILFVLLEKIRGKRLATQIEQRTHTIGFMILIGLMLLITFKDIQRFF